MAPTCPLFGAAAAADAAAAATSLDTRVSFGNDDVVSTTLHAVLLAAEGAFAGADLPSVQVLVSCKHKYFRAVVR
jgi:hypothetical protein